MLLAWLGGVVRGGPLKPGQMAQAMARLTTEEPPPVSRAGVIFALTRLVAGKSSAIAFVEIGPDAVSLQTLVVDGLGNPVQLDGESLAWPEIIPLPRGNLGLLYLRMAGGVGIALDEDENVGPPALITAFGDGILPVLARFTEAAAKSAALARADRAPEERLACRPIYWTPLLVRRTHNWPSLDAAAARTLC